jgi:uncharacterized iron-regulated membrane protein
MWLIVFMAGCTVPLIVLAGIVLWREKRWEKYNENQTAQPNA